MRQLLRPAVTLMIVLTALLGLAYPAAVTVVVQAVFPGEANGSTIHVDGRAIGSSLIGQAFSDPGHFWGRPSATAPYPYNAACSAGSNLGQTNPALLEAVKQRVAALRAADPANHDPIPVDLVTASASGLDPHVSPDAARYQAARVARARGLSLPSVLRLIEAHIEGRGVLGWLGQPRVNVLGLNIALDQLSKSVE